MESEELSTDRAAAAAQLAALQADRERLARRVVTPWWYDACLGLTVLLLLSSISFRDSVWQFVVGGAGLLLLWGVATAYRRITGVWVNGLRRGRTRRLMWIWLALYTVVLALAAGAEFVLGLRGAMVVGGAVLGVALALISRWWMRIYVAELRGEAVTAVVPRFDAVIHPPPRLQICGLLAVVDTMEFAAVRDEVGVSDSVLSKHVKQLEEAGYVKVRKATIASRVRTSLSLTAAGRAAFDAHVAELRRITGG